MSEVGEGILRGLEQALAFIEGTADDSQYVVHIPPEIDIKAIRGRLGMTQQEFAKRFDFNINTLRHWEQGQTRSRRDGARLSAGDRPRNPRPCKRLCASPERDGPLVSRRTALPKRIVKKSCYRLVGADIKLLGVSLGRRCLGCSGGLVDSCLGAN